MAVVLLLLVFHIKYICYMKDTVSQVIQIYLQNRKDQLNTIKLFLVYLFRMYKQPINCLKKNQICNNKED